MSKCKQCNDEIHPSPYYMDLCKRCNDFAELQRNLKHAEDMYDLISKKSATLQARVADMKKALNDIAEFGKKNPGCGHTCAKMAAKAVGGKKDTEYPACIDCVNRSTEYSKICDECWKGGNAEPKAVGGARCNCEANRVCAECQQPKENDQ